MSGTVPTQLTYQGEAMDLSSDAFGLLSEANEDLGHSDRLRARLTEEGHLLLRGAIPRETVLSARRAVLERMREEGVLDPKHPLMDGVARPGTSFGFRPDLVRDLAEIRDVVFGPALMQVFETIFAEDVRHYDFIWFRCKSPGPQTATPPHCDIVYMGRGTPRVLTAWTPIGDVPWELGGLMLMEGSHKREDTLHDYWAMDVDTYCDSSEDADAYRTGRKQGWSADKNGGSFDVDARGLRERMRTRWLSSTFEAGDVLVFNMFTLHGSLDNRTDRFRLSTDTRYQPASEPADERWIGPDPIGHGPASKRELIC